LTQPPPVVIWSTASHSVIDLAGFRGGGCIGSDLLCSLTGFAFGIGCPENAKAGDGGNQIWPELADQTD
jgi:hypothetical protein